MPLACKICVMTRGIRSSEIGSLPQNEEELADHLEAVHHMPVTREGETDAQAQARFLAKYPEARTCSECIAARAPWTKNNA